MSLRVVVALPAERQIRATASWWRLNRLAAPELFEQELSATFDTLSTHPRVGARVRHRSVRGLRRTLLRSSRYHVYYVATEQEVIILAVWSAVRGSGPPLSALT